MKTRDKKHAKAKSPLFMRFLRLKLLSETKNGKSREKLQGGEIAFCTAKNIDTPTGIDIRDVARVRVEMPNAQKETIGSSNN
jgi:hypothetical protein